MPIPCGTGAPFGARDTHAAFQCCIVETEAKPSTYLLHPAPTYVAWVCQFPHTVSQGLCAVALACLSHIGQSPSTTYTCYFSEPLPGGTGMSVCEPTVCPSNAMCCLGMPVSIPEIYLSTKSWLCSHAGSQVSHVPVGGGAHLFAHNSCLSCPPWWHWLTCSHISCALAPCYGSIDISVHMYFVPMSVLWADHTC